MANKDIVIFDLDGTVANSDWRAPMIKPDSGKKDWDAYYAGIPQDTVNEAEQKLVWMFRGDPDMNVLFFTGRPEKHRRATQLWLGENNVTHLCDACDPGDILRMRKDGDYRPDYIVKPEMLRPGELERVLVVFEDRDQMVNVWRAMGLRCFQVQEGKY